MFKVQSANTYIVGEYSVAKNHYVSNHEMAKAIRLDLATRFPDEYEINEIRGAPLYDPGGPLITEKPIYNLGIIDVGSQFCDTLMAHLNNVISNPPRETSGLKYYKLHCKYMCIVLTPEEANLVLTAITFKSMDSLC